MVAGAALAGSGLVGTLSTAADEHDGDSEDEDSTENGTSDFERPNSIAWRYDGPHDIHSTIATDDRVYTQSGGSVSALDAADGSLVWETGDIGASGTPAVEEETVYVAGDPVQAINTETGEIRWESEFGSPEMAAGHGMVYTSEDGTVYALDAADGSIEWERDELEVEQGPDDDTETITVEELTMGDVDEDRMYVFGRARGGVFAGLDPSTGDVELTVTHVEFITRLIAGSGYVATFPEHDSAYLFDVAEREAVTSTLPAVDHVISGNGYFVSRRDGTFLAYDLSDATEPVWRTEYAHSLPDVVGNTVVSIYAPRSVEDDPDEEEDEDRVMAYNLQTGDEEWRYVFDEREWDDGAATAVVANNHTVYVSRDDELLALRFEDDEEPEEPTEEEPKEEPEEEKPEEEPEEEEKPEEEPEEPVEVAPSLELSVSAPDSVAHGETACFDITVRNHGDDAVEVTITLEVGDVTESSTFEIAAGDCYASFHTVAGSDLPVGDTEWTVTADGETERGVLTVTDE